MKKPSLYGGRHIRNQDNETGVQAHLTEKLNKIGTVIRDEREFVHDDPFPQYPVRLAVQTEVVDMSCREPSGMGQPY